MVPVVPLGIGGVIEPPLVCALTDVSVNVNSSSVFGVSPLTIFFTGIYFVTGVNVFVTSTCPSSFTPSVMFATSAPLASVVTVIVTSWFEVS